MAKYTYLIFLLLILSCDRHIDVQPTDLPKGTIRDIPLVENRQLMLDVGRKYFSMDYLKIIIRNMAWYKLNTLHLHFTEWSGF